MRLFLILISLLLSFDVMAYEMTCEVVKSVQFQYIIARCENKEVVCYISREWSGETIAPMQCKFKSVSADSKACISLIDSLNGNFSDDDKSLIITLCKGES